MENNEQCPNVNKLFRGCKFKPRYSIIPPDVGGARGTYAIMMQPKLLQAGTRTAYEGDVCVRCGKFSSKTGS